MKLLTILALMLSLAVSVDAKQNKNQAAKNKQAEAQKQKEQAAHDKKREQLTAAMKAKDTNHDGSLTKDEYVAGESDKDAAGKKFDQFNKNGDRSLSRSELEDSLGL